MPSLEILIFILLSPQTFAQMKNTSPSFFTQHLEWPVGVHRQKRNEVNSTKNDRVRSVFVEEFKILDSKPFAQNRDFRRFGGNFCFRGMGPIFGGLAPIFVLLLNNCLYFRVVH